MSGYGHYYYFSILCVFLIISFIFPIYLTNIYKLACKMLKMDIKQPLTGKNISRIVVSVKDMWLLQYTVDFLFCSFFFSFFCYFSFLILLPHLQKMFCFHVATILETDWLDCLLKSSQRRKKPQSLHQYIRWPTNPSLEINLFGAVGKVSWAWRRLP